MIDAESFFQTKAALEVIIDEAHGLHEGVASGWADEGPAAFFEILAESDGFWGGREGLSFLPSEGCSPQWRLKLDKVGVEGFELGEEVESAMGVVDGGEDLAAMADDARVLDEAGEVGFGEFCHLVKIKLREC